MGILAWLRRRRFDLDEEDFNEEIRAHLAIAAAEKVTDGTDPEEARYAALREFGNVPLTKERTRRVWMPPWLEAARDAASDVRYAIRTLVKNPTFSLTVVAVLTLGIGLNAAVFTMLKSLVLSPIAGVDGSASLRVVVPETTSGRPARLSYPEYRYLHDHDQAFEELFGSIVATVNLGRGRGARQVWGEIVTGNYFQALGVRAQLGRMLEPHDEIAPGGHPVVVLSDGLWRRDFGADPAILGRAIEINNVLLTVVGVADPAFHGTTVVYDVEVYVPVMMAPSLGFTLGSQQATPAGILSDRRAAFFFPQGYLRPGTTMRSAAAQADARWAELRKERPAADTVQRLRIVPFWQMPYGAPGVILPTLGVLTATAFLVLMIACANIAGLVLVRGVSRRGEIAVRLALGATRARIVRLLVVETLVLALPGAALGVLLAQRGIPLLVGYAEWLAAPQRVFFNIEVDALVIGFAMLTACACAVVFGFVPALRSSRMDLVAAVNEDASPRSAPRGGLRGTLVVAQVAVSLLLLVGAGLAMRSVDAARRADPGFDSTGVTAIAVDVRQNAYDDAGGRVFYRRLLEAARADSAIESAALAAHHPLTMQDTRALPVGIEGYEPGPDEELAFMSNAVSPDYFRTLRIGVLSGREFEERDDETGQAVAIVNRTLADRFFGSAAGAIGRRIRLADGDWRTIVGVAADVKYARIDEPSRPYVYLPFLQAYRSSMILHTRGHAAPGSVPPVDTLVARAREHVAVLDTELPILSARPLEEAIRGAFIFLDLTATMLFIFGAAGMVLAAMGTYGLVSYTVAQSTHEIGIRMTLGASRGTVVRAFLARGLRLGVVGATIGIVAALGAARLLGSVLFGVSATDTTSFMRAAVVVLAGVLLATFVPAWRASRTDPLHALRHR